MNRLKFDQISAYPSAVAVLAALVHNVVKEISHESYAHWRSRLPDGSRILFGLLADTSECSEPCFRAGGRGTSSPAGRTV